MTVILSNLRKTQDRLFQKEKQKNKLFIASTAIIASTGMDPEAVFLIRIPLETGWNFLGLVGGHHWAIMCNDIVYEIGQSGKTKQEAGLICFQHYRYTDWCANYKKTTVAISTKTIIGSTRKTHNQIKVS